MDSTHKRPPGQTAAMIRTLYLKGVTIREIARLTDTSAQNVTAHIRRLRAAGEVDGRRVQ